MFSASKELFSQHLRPSGEPSSLSAKVLVFSLGVLAVGWVMAGVYLFLGYQSEMRYWESRLSATAEARLRETEHWIEDRQDDARYLAGFPGLTAVLRGAPEEVRRFRTQLELQKTTHHYAALCLHDPSGRLALNTRGDEGFCRLARRQGLLVAQGRGASIFLQGRSPEEGLFGFCAGLKGAEQSQVCLWMSLKDQFLGIFEQAQSSAQTVETLLVCRIHGGKDILFLSRPRFLAQAAPFLRVGDERRELAAWAALEAPRSFRTFRDYRGKPIFASALRMGSTGWGMVCKVDRAEALERFYALCVVILLLTLSLTAVWLMLRSLYLRDRRERAAAEHRRLSELGEEAQRKIARTELMRLRLVEAMDSGYAHHRIMFDATGRPCDYVTLDMNAAFERQTGLRRGDVLGRRIRELLPGLEDALVQRYGKVALTGKPDAFESWVEPLQKWFSVRAFSPKPGEFAVLFDDITEQKRAAQTLADSERRFRAALNGSRIAVWEQDRELRYTWLHNHPILSAEAVGRSDEELLSPELWDSIIPGKRRVLSSGVGMHDTLYITLEGRLRAFDRRLEPLRGADGEVQGLIGTAVEVTEQLRTLKAFQEGERRLRSLFDASPVALAAFRATEIAIANAAFAELFGFKSREAVLGTDPMLLLPEDLRGRFREVFQRRLSGEEPPAVYETEGLRLDGTRFPMLVQAGRAILSDGPVVLVHSTDLSERKRLEEQLRQSQKMDAVGRLAGGVAHDFNNLLTAIQGYAELLSAQIPKEDPRRADLEEILEASERASALTRQLLAFSRRQVLSPVTLSVNETVERMLKMLQRLLGEDIQLSLQLDPELGPVRVDPGQFEQVLMNLAVNARDAMPRGGTLVVGTTGLQLDEDFCRLHPDLTPGPYAQIFVSDSGAGMSRQQLERLFEPFNTTKEKGTGLGLSTAYGIIKQSGGAIEAESVEGLGTVFKIYLPIVEGRPERRRRTATDVPLPGGRETVLLAEDERVVRNLARRILQEAGYTVLEACDGEDALRVAQAHGGTVDLLLTDVVMPRMSGRELCERLGTQRPGLKKVYMSGYTDDAILRHGVRDRSLPFIQKPFSRQSLLKAVRAALDGVKI